MPLDVEAARAAIRAPYEATDETLAANREGRLHPRQVAQRRRDDARDAAYQWALPPGLAGFAVLVVRLAPDDPLGPLQWWDPAGWAVAAGVTGLSSLTGWVVTRRRPTDDGPVTSVRGRLRLVAPSGQVSYPTVEAAGHRVRVPAHWVGLPVEVLLHNGYPVAVDLDLAALDKDRRGRAPTEPTGPDERPCAPSGDPVVVRRALLAVQGLTEADLARVREGREPAGRVQSARDGRERWWAASAVAGVPLNVAAAVAAGPADASPLALAFSLGLLGCWGLVAALGGTTPVRDTAVSHRTLTGTLRWTGDPDRRGLAPARVLGSDLEVTVSTDARAQPLRRTLDDIPVVVHLLDGGVAAVDLDADAAAGRSLPAVAVQDVPEDRPAPRRAWVRRAVIAAGALACAAPWPLVQLLG